MESNNFKGNQQGVGGGASGARAPYYNVHNNSQRNKKNKNNQQQHKNNENFNNANRHNFNKNQLNNNNFNKNMAINNILFNKNFPNNNSPINNNFNNLSQNFVPEYVSNVSPPSTQNQNFNFGYVSGPEMSNILDSPKKHNQPHFYNNNFMKKSPSSHQFRNHNNFGNNSMNMNNHHQNRNNNNRHKQFGRSSSNSNIKENEYGYQNTCRVPSSPSDPSINSHLYGGNDFSTILNEIKQSPSKLSAMIEETKMSRNVTEEIIKNDEHDINYKHNVVTETFKEEVATLQLDPELNSTLVNTTATQELDTSDTQTDKDYYSNAPVSADQSEISENQYFSADETNHVQTSSSDSTPSKSSPSDSSESLTNSASSSPTPHSSSSENNKNTSDDKQREESCDSSSDCESGENKTLHDDIEKTPIAKKDFDDSNSDDEKSASSCEENKIKKNDISFDEEFKESQQQHYNELTASNNFEILTENMIPEINLNRSNTNQNQNYALKADESIDSEHNLELEIESEDRNGVETDELELETENKNVELDSENKRIVELESQSKKAVDDDVELKNETKNKNAQLEVEINNVDNCSENSVESDVSTKTITSNYSDLEVSANISVKSTLSSSADSEKKNENLDCEHLNVATENTELNKSKEEYKEEKMNSYLKENQHNKNDSEEENVQIDNEVQVEESDELKTLVNKIVSDVISCAISASPLDENNIEQEINIIDPIKSDIMVTITNTNELINAALLDSMHSSKCSEDENYVKVTSKHILNSEKNDNENKPQIEILNLSNLTLPCTPRSETNLISSPSSNDSIKKVKSKKKPSAGSEVDCFGCTVL